MADNRIQDKLDDEAKKVFNVVNDQKLTTVAKLVEVAKGVTFNSFSDFEFSDEYSRYLGTPVLGTLTFEGGSYTTLDGEVRAFETIKIEHAIITVRKSKNFVETQLTGKNGTVLEYIGDGNYQIEIQGSVTNGRNQLPKEEIILLKELCDVPKPVTVKNDFLQLFDINEVAISDRSFPQQAGVRNIQNFTITAQTFAEVNFEVFE